MKRLVYWVLLLWMVASVQASDKLVGGPYVIKVGPRSATVAWSKREKLCWARRRINSR